LNHETPTIFKNIWNPLSKLGALTVYSNIVFHHTYLCTIIFTYVISVGIFMYGIPYIYKKTHLKAMYIYTVQRAAEGQQARPLVNRDGHGTNYPSIDSV